MRIPRSFKIGRRKWRVKIVDQINGGKMVGECNHRKATISISTDQNRTEMEKTLVHEIMHASFPAGIVSDKTEEKLVSAMELKMWEILKQII